MSLDLNRRDFLMIGSIGMALGLAARAGAAPGQFALQNIAARGQVHNGAVAAAGAKTRYKAIYRFTIGAGGARSVAPVFSNFWLNNVLAREVNGAAPYTIRKAAVMVGTTVVPCNFGGARSATVAGGTIDLCADPILASQFGLEQFAPGIPVYVRFALDLPAGQTVSGHPSPMYLGGESILAFDPANDIDDIDLATFATPTGADVWVGIPGPIMLAGIPATPVTSLIGLGDSILDGSVDTAGDGSAGGGWLRRAAYAAGMPYLSISRTGDKAQFIAASNVKTSRLLAYGHAAVLALGNNDLRDGRTAAQFLGDLRSIWSLLRANGIAHICQAQVIGETGSTEQNTTVAGQTPIAVSGPGVRDAVNAVIAALDGGAIDDQIDIPGVVQSNYRWNVPTFTSTLAAAVAPYAGSVSLNHLPQVGDFLAFEPATPANQDVTYFHVTAVSGTGPYNASLTFGPSKAHAAGIAVRSSMSGDGIHPQLKAHAAIATKAAPAMRRITAVKVAWINATKSFEIDFVNRRAQSGGIAVPISSLVSCARASAGKASDGISWFDFPANALRYADGGGLFVEAAKTNLIPRTDWSGAPASVPAGWDLANRGLAATYETFTENGMNVLRVRLNGTTTSGVASLGFRMAAGLRPAAAAGESWSASCYVRRSGAPVNPLNIQCALEEYSAAGVLLDGTYGAGTASRNWQRLEVSRLMANAGTAFSAFNVILGGNAAGTTAYDLTTDIAFPMLEKAGSTSSPITTTGAAAARAADEVTIVLPPGSHNLTFSFDNNTTQTVNGVSGNYLVPLDLNRGIINTIRGEKMSG